MLSYIQGAAILRFLVYVTGALLKKARIGGIFANNCDCDVSNPQIPLDRNKMFERACASNVSGLRHWYISLKMAAP